MAFAEIDVASIESTLACDELLVAGAELYMASGKTDVSSGNEGWRHMCEHVAL